MISVWVTVEVWIVHFGEIWDDLETSHGFGRCFSWDFFAACLKGSWFRAGWEKGLFPLFWNFCCCFHLQNWGSLCWHCFLIATLGPVSGHSVSADSVLSVLWLCCSWQIFNPAHCWSCSFAQVSFACCVAGSLQLQQHQKGFVAWQFLRPLQRQRPCRRHRNGMALA